MSLQEVAQLIDRFLQGTSLYPQEWNDFVETPQIEGRIDEYRKRCYKLDPLVNRPGDMDPKAVVELRAIVQELRNQSARTE